MKRDAGKGEMGNERVEQVKRDAEKDEMEMKKWKMAEWDDEKGGAMTKGNGKENLTHIFITGFSLSDDDIGRCKHDAAGGVGGGEMKNR